MPEPLFFSETPASNVYPSCGKIFRRETLTLVLMGEHVRRGGGGRRRSGRAGGRHPVEGLRRLHLWRHVQKGDVLSPGSSPGFIDTHQFWI